MKSAVPDSVTSNDFADLIGVTPRHVGNLVASGIVTRAGRGRIALKASIRAMITDAKRSAGADQLSGEHAAFVKAKRRTAELRLAERQRELIPLTEAIAVIDDVVGSIRHALDAIPAQISRDPATRNTCRELIDAALERAAGKLEQLENGDLNHGTDENH
ncbi:MAG: hypothetical protein JNM13_14805 [Hyphomicrobiaceae bacterium]|nr:hypothetical protein [Hyphomicrobiaceae bacterium]